MAVGILLSLALVSVALSFWQFCAAQKFPLHQRRAPAAPPPGVTILKPLKGADTATRDCLESWCRQQYGGPVQILFGVREPADPARAVAASLIDRYGRPDWSVVTCGSSLGANPKVSTLAQLWPQARHQHIVISDADVKVGPDFLENFVAALEEPEAGLVCAFYRIPDGPTLAMRVEAVAVNADFWSQVLQSQTLKPAAFALGAAMLTTRAKLEGIGGFPALADYLADDYELGRRIASSGSRIIFSPMVVDCLGPVQGWGEVWRHQLRWARTIRVCQPVPYFFSILSNVSLWLLLLALAGLPAWALAMAAAGLGWRMFNASLLQSRLCQKPRFGTWWLAPLKDALAFLAWAAAFCGQEITWRGERFRLRRSGKLERAGADVRSL